MNDFMIYTPIVVSLYLFWMAFAMHTKNLTSAVLFQYIPFLSGLALLFVGVKLGGWL